MEIILSRVGAGFYPARFAAPSQLSPVGRHPCVPPLDTRRIPNGGAHWLRPTVVLPTPHPMSRTAPSNPVIARSGATWQSVLLLHRISDLCVGAGFYPARFAAPSQLSPVGRHPCVPPLDTRRIPNGGAHWLRPTVVLPTPHPMSRTAPSNPVIARSGATWQSVLLLHRTSNLCVGAGFYPAYLPRISNHAPVGRHPCVPPPIDRRTPKNVIVHP